MRLDRNGMALAAFGVGTVLAGGNAVGVRVSNRELDPLWGAGLRFALAACLLGAVMALMRLPLPHGRALVGDRLLPAESGLLNLRLGPDPETERRLG